jgi:hypothetical protein
MHKNKLGIFVRPPVAGQVKTRLVPPLTPDQARDLYAAFLGDLFERLHRAGVAPTIFYSGDDAGDLPALMPRPWPLVAQRGETLGERMAVALGLLLDTPGARAALIGSDSPDLPLGHLKTAFQKLKHRDVVLGPAMDGGYWLVGLRAPAPALFDGIPWGTASVFADTVERVRRESLTLSLLPPWYDVDDAASLSFLRAMCAARRAAGGLRLPRTERALDGIHF